MDSIERIEAFPKDMTFAAFDKDRMVQDAVIRNFEIIGEAGSHIPSSIQNHYSEIPWRQIVSMRNFLIHEYFGADNSVIWDTIQIHLSKLKSQLMQIAIDHSDQDFYKNTP